MKEKIEEWRWNQLPQRINSLSWPDTLTYHPFLTYQSEKFKRHIEQLDAEKTDTFSIAIVGGSFAEILAYYLNDQEGSEVFSILSKEFGITKNIKFINLAEGGYRQPQQLFASVLFFERVDAFLSVEGFNDLVNGDGEPCLPREWNNQSLRFMDIKNSNSRVGLFMFKKMYLLLDYLVQNNLGIATLFLYTFDDTLMSVYWSLQDNLRNAAVGNCSEDSSQRKDPNRIVKNWIQDVQKHHLIVEGAGKKIVTVFQPNQYDPGSKIISENENILSRSSGPKERVQVLYPLAKRQFLNLSKRHAKSFVDMTEVYKMESRDIYKDGCCHVNDLGNKILLEQLMPHIKYLSQ